MAKKRPMAAWPRLMVVALAFAADQAGNSEHVATPLVR
jgi:hypothetical protein